MPDFVKVKLNWAPGANGPLLKIFVSEVTVWAVWSRLTHVIVELTGTVMVLGWKEKLEISTVGSESEREIGLVENTIKVISNKTIIMIAIISKGSIFSL